MKWKSSLFAAVSAASASLSAAPAFAQELPLQFVGTDPAAMEFNAGPAAPVVLVTFADMDALDEIFPGQKGNGIGPQVRSLPNDVNVVEENGKTFITRGEAIKLEVIFQALNVLDWATTKYCLDRGTCKEGNAIWGEDPDMTKMAFVKLGIGAMHAAYMYFLYENAPSLYKPFAYGSIVLYGGVVAWNLQFAF